MLMNKRMPGARAAVIYITIGALIDVWSGIWGWKLLNDPTRGDNALYWCFGLLLTGATLMVIGLGIGWIGRTRRTEEPAAGPGETVTSAVPPAEQPVASPAPVPGIGQDRGHKSI